LIILKDFILIIIYHSGGCYTGCVILIKQNAYFFEVIMENKEIGFPKNKIKILLLENIHQAAADRLSEAGYSVELSSASLSEDELLERIKDVHVLGIRSKTKVTAKHIEAAHKLLAIGCFGIGTNQVDLATATSHAVPVFNAPYGSTRSVAELAIAHALCLARHAGDANRNLHNHFWDKSAKGSHEIRGKTMGIVGYGHIGQQVGLLAESMGMKVIFYDQTKRLALGNAKAIDTMTELLKEADYVSLHVPAQPGNKALIGAKELAYMKKTACLINLGRGSLIDFVAVKEAIQNKCLGGIGVDVYPAEPKGNKEEFYCELADVENVMMTPHLGGSTEEAQYNIGIEVATSFIKFVDAGCTAGAVNFPQVDLPPSPDSHRILNIHKNVPGVLSDVNKIISELGANINSQYLGTYKDVGYLVMDVAKGVSLEVKEHIAALSTNIKTRMLY